MIKTAIFGMVLLLGVVVAPDPNMPTPEPGSCLAQMHSCMTEKPDDCDDMMEVKKCLMEKKYKRTCSEEVWEEKLAPIKEKIMEFMKDKCPDMMDKDKDKYASSAATTLVSVSALCAAIFAAFM